MRTRQINAILFLTFLVSMPNTGLFARTITSTSSQNGTERLNETLVINSDYTINGDLTATEVTINTGCSLTINGHLNTTGNLTILGDGRLTINEGGMLLVANNFNAKHTENGLINKTKNYPNVVVNGSMTVEGTFASESHLTVDGEIETENAIVKQDLIITENGALVVYDQLTNYGVITDNGRLEAGRIDVVKELTISSNAILYVIKDKSDSKTNGDLIVRKDGKISFEKNSATIVEGDLIQDGSTLLGIHLLFPNTGDIKAHKATVIVEGAYHIYTTEFNKSDDNCEYIDPKDNPRFFSFGGIIQSTIKHQTL